MGVGGWRERARPGIWQTAKQGLWGTLSMAPRFSGPCLFGALSHRGLVKGEVEIVRGEGYWGKRLRCGLGYWRSNVGLALASSEAMEDIFPTQRDLAEQ